MYTCRDDLALAKKRCLRLLLKTVGEKAGILRLHACVWCIRAAGRDIPRSVAPMTTSGMPSQSPRMGVHRGHSRVLSVASRAGVSLKAQDSKVSDTSGLLLMSLGQESDREGELVS